MFQLDTGILSSELPVDGGRSLITSCFPGSHFFAKELFLPDTLVQALTGKDIEFNLSHIEPTAMLWRVVELNAFQNAPRFFWDKRFIESGWLVDAEVVLHESDARRMGIPDIDQDFQALGIVNHRSAVSHFDMPPTAERFEKHEEIAGAMPFIFIIIALRRTWLHRQWCTCLANQLFCAFIETNYRLLRIIRFMASVGN